MKVDFIYFSISIIEQYFEMIVYQRLFTEKVP